MWAAGLALLLCGCFQDTAPQHSDFLPLDYQTKFQTVRDCRLVVGHENNYLKVLANSVAADPYNPASYPLPQGSVVVAEQHGGDPSCGSINGYYLMAKEQPGYFSAGGDWHWQRLDVNQRIVEDGRLQTCASCHAACAASEYLCSPP
jgi:hypothetical protein